MSAINDALRRASGAASGGGETSSFPSEPPPLPVDLPPLGMSDELPPLLEPAPKKGISLLVMIIVIVLCGAAGAAGTYLWKRSRAVVAAKTPTDSYEATVRVRATKQPSAPEQASAISSQSEPAKVSPTPVVAAPVKPVAPAPVPAPIEPSPAPRAPVQFPPLRLQGIYFKPSNPSVMINNRALFIGDQVQGVTVVSIDSSSVTLVLSGQTNVLTLR